MTERLLPPAFHATVVGVSHVPGYPDTIFRLERLTVRRDLWDEGPVRAELRREPDDPHDPNAIVVEIPGIGPVGHIPASLAARLAAELDNGRRWECEVIQVKCSIEHIHRPGVELELRVAT